MERKLATIAKILSVSPIPEADAIEKVTIRGWQVVTKKGEFKVGDLCVYCEIDSLLPDRPEFEFLRDKQFRIRTVRLRGTVSQGIVFPLTVLNTENYKVVYGYIDEILLHPISGNFDEQIVLSEGLNVTELLNITKYEKPIPACLSGIARGNFPGNIPRTDEERVQNFILGMDVINEETNEFIKHLPSTIELYTGLVFSVSEKLDGSSGTFARMWDDEFHVCSRNLDLEETEGNTFWQIAKQYYLEEKLKNLNRNIAIQGEVVGEGINGNHLQLKGKEFFVFSMFDIEKQLYVPFEERLQLCESMGLKHVPIIYTDLTITKDMTIEYFVEMAKGFSALTPACLREGLVYSTKDNVGLEFGFAYGKISFKAINNDYILKHKE